MSRTRRPTKNFIHDRLRLSTVVDTHYEKLLANSPLRSTLKMHTYSNHRHPQFGGHVPEWIWA